VRQRFDQLGKEIGLRALELVGRRDRTNAQHALNAETLYADLRHEPDPSRAAEREQLGLLGRLAAHECLIEIHSEPPGRDDFRACLAKHLTYWQQRARDARAGGESVVSDLWIISSGMPRRLFGDLTFVPAQDWPTGVYRFGGDALRVALVVANELPVERSTLFVRLMAGGPVSLRAIPEVAALARTDPMRLVAGPVLLQFAHVLQQKPRQELDEKEQEFIMTMYKTWDDARDEGREEGREEGRLEGRKEALRRLLALKFGELSPQDEHRIEQAAPEQLERFLERILFSDSASAVLA
jgi:hypothetical protein